MKKSLFYICAAFGFASCSHIADDDHLIYVAPAEVQRSVLIEDFTGQKCVNCPDATKVIEDLQQQYGESAVIAVALHGGGFGISTDNTRMKGLATQTAEEYYTYWSIDAQPSGLVNRRGGVLGRSLWTAAVHDELSQKSSVSINDVICSVDDDDRELTVLVSCLASKAYTGRLQLWLTEDSIIAPQSLADGSVDMQYLHNHVFRTSINGPWGTDLTLGEYQAHQSFTMTIPAEYDLPHLSVVAFIYNDDGVESVVRKRIVR